MNGLNFLRGMRKESAAEKPAQIIERPLLPPQEHAVGFATNVLSKPQSTSYKNTNMATPSTMRDPVSMHLLMETAMGDSEQYQVLSQIELDALKRELSRVSSQLDSTTHELSLETKVRDAARSMDRLPSKASKDFSRPGSRGKGNDAGKNNEEVAQSAKRCEELTQDILKMEKEEHQLQKRLLEHTAGVLQLTHRGFLAKDPSPEDIKHGYHFPGMDMDGEFGGLGQYALYSEVLKNELNGVQSTADLSDQHQMILGVERKVEDLNARLRGIILELRPQKQTLPQPPRQLGDDPNNVGEILLDQVEFLEKCLDTLNGLQNSRGVASESRIEKYDQLVLDVEHRIEESNLQLRGMILDLKPRKEELPDPARGLGENPNDPEGILVEQVGFLEACLASLQTLLDQKREAGVFETPEDKLEALNKTLFNLMTQNDPDRAAKYFPPPEANGTTILDQFEYLQQGLKAVDRRMGELGDFEENSSEKLISYQKRAEQYVAVIGGLWDILMAEELEQAAREGRPSPPDNFSLQLFSKKVQELHAKYLEMVDQKDVLTRQIQQQRDLNSTADTTKDQKMNNMRDENEALRSQLQATSEEAAVHLEKLNLTAAELEAAKNMLSMRDEQQGLSNSRSLEEEKQSRRLAEEQLAAQTALAVQAENSRKELESDVVRLRTELTIAKAELDSAHGTRAQRAAEAAADPALQARIQTLQNELSDTIADYEAMTKATIEFERERDHLENTVDDLKDKVDSLERQLTEEKINTMGIKSPGNESTRSTAGGTSVAVMRAEMRKMNHETSAAYKKVKNALEAENKDLKGKNRVLAAENITQKKENASLTRENDKLKAKLAAAGIPI